MRRVMSIWFPQLPLDRFRRRDDPRLVGPFATIHEQKNAWRLLNANDHAIRAGVRSEMSLTDARAICPDLLTATSDPVREERLLRALWRWSEKFSPSAAMEMPNGLFIDIGGCAHLFGGEAKMAEMAQADLSQMRLCARIAICDTKRGAWALSHYGHKDTELIPGGDTKAALAELPVIALGLKAETSSALRRAGLKTIGSLYPFKTSDLARRFGLELTQRLSHALGYSPDPVSTQSRDPVYAARMTLPEPIGLMDDVMDVTRRLAENVCGRLEAERKGARQFTLTVRCVDSGDHPLEVGFARPCFKPDQLLQQLRPKLDALSIAFGADWFRLHARMIEPLKPQQLSLEANAHSEDFDAQSGAIATLGNRLGFDRVLKLAPCEAHIPEREYQTVEAVRSSDRLWPKDRRLRPERIFSDPEYCHVLQDGRPPRRFEWRRQAYEAAQVIGPERLAPSWWMRGDHRVRDYWIIVTTSGLRLWLMTFPASQSPQWYVAGKFA